MTIKQIFDEISAESSTNKKKEILAKYKDNELLKRVLYLANSPRVKFYIKQIPAYTCHGIQDLQWGVDVLSNLIDRVYTGHDAINHLAYILGELTEDDAYVVERIVSKDCRVGMGSTFMNEVIPNLIETTNYMGALSYSETKAKKIFEDHGMAYSQKKMDGRYCAAVIQNGFVHLESRQGEKTLVTGAKFLEELQNFEDCVLTGEITMSGISRYESNGIVSSLIDIIGKRGERTEKENDNKLSAFEKKHMKFEEALNKLEYTVWDVIKVNEYFDGKSEVTYVERFHNLETLISKHNAQMVSIVETRKVKSYAEAMEHFQELLKGGHEGTILKGQNGFWRDGKHANNIKMKLEMDIDLKIVGFNYGTGKNAYVISSVVCESSDGKLVTQPTGFKEQMMKFITENQDKLLGTIMECTCSGLSQNHLGEYSVLHPRYSKLREDKLIANSLEECVEIENMAKGLIKGV